MFHNTSEFLYTFRPIVSRQVAVWIPINCGALPQEMMFLPKNDAVLVFALATAARDVSKLQIGLSRRSLEMISWERMQGKRAAATVRLGYGVAGTSAGLQHVSVIYLE